MFASAFTSATATAARLQRATDFDRADFDRTALCQEIRSSDLVGTLINSRHHWTAGPNMPNRFLMQSISCAKCGNYIMVSSGPLYSALLETAPTILCLDEEHDRFTSAIVALERREDDTFYTTEPLELVTNILGNWSTTCELIGGLLERLDALKEEIDEDNQEKEEDDLFRRVLDHERRIQDENESEEEDEKEEDESEDEEKRRIAIDKLREMSALIGTRLERLYTFREDDETNRRFALNKLHEMPASSQFSQFSLEDYGGEDENDDRFYDWN